MWNVCTRPHFLQIFRRVWEIQVMALARKYECKSLHNCATFHPMKLIVNIDIKLKILSFFYLWNYKVERLSRMAYDSDGSSWAWVHPLKNCNFKKLLKNWACPQTPWPWDKSWITVISVMTLKLETNFTTLWSVVFSVENNMSLSTRPCI